MFYFNIKPIVEKFNTSDLDLHSDFYNLGKIFDLIDSEFPVYQQIKKSQHSLMARELAAFQNATLLGDTTIISSSAIINLKNTTVSVNIDGDSVEYEDVYQILPIDYDKITIKSQGSVIDGGFGFYSNVFFNSSNVNFSGESPVILINFQNGKQSIINGNEIKMNLPESNMLIHQPLVVTNGLTKFVDFYSFRDLNKKIQVLNEDMQFLGNLTFKTKFSDEFTIVLNPTFDGKIIRTEQKYPYEELGNLRNIFN